MATSTTLEGHRAIKRSFTKAARVLAPPPLLTLSEWADQFARLSSEDSSITGQWVSETYQREPMDAITDPAIQDVVLMWASQTGKTAIMKHVIAYHIAQDPAPIMLVQPTLDMAKAVSEDRISPMFRDTPCLQGKVKDARSRDSGNKVLHKAFPGGHLTMVGANSPASLASRPIRILLLDEIDRYVESAGKEGSPVKLAKKRTVRFWNRKHIYTSTPILKAGPVDSLYGTSSRGHFMAPCPHCGHHQTLYLTQLHWPKGERPTADNVWYECEGNRCRILESDKAAMIHAGHWEHEVPDAIVRGYHINQLYSPAVGWHETAQEFLDAKHEGRNTLQTFFNTAMAEPWEEASEQVDATGLTRHKHDYGVTESGARIAVPDWAVLLTCGVDVQRDRLEYEVVGWGEGYESWSIEYGIIIGETDPNKRKQLAHDGAEIPDPFRDLDAVLLKSYHHASGADLRIAGVMVDSGDGAMTQHVYNFVSPRTGRRVWACKGIHGEGPIVPPKPTVQRNGARLWGLHVDTAKGHVYGNLRIEEFGTGYCHFPLDDVYNEEYFKQLTAEKWEPPTIKGGKRYSGRWIQKRARNEALDCRVYALAAREALHPNLDALRQAIENATKTIPAPQPPQGQQPMKMIQPQEPPKPQPQPQRRVIRNPFVNGRNR